jgi:hypothetical protein
MLRPDVVTAAAEGRFAIYPIDTIDQGIALLTGIPAGEPDADGIYPPDTINRRVADRLDALPPEPPNSFATPRRWRDGYERPDREDRRPVRCHFGDARRHRPRGPPGCPRQGDAARLFIKDKSLLRTRICRRSSSSSGCSI